MYLNCQPCPNKKWAEPGQQCRLPALTPNNTVRVSIAALCGVGIAFTLLSCALLFHFRSVRLIKASSPILMFVLQIGCVLAFLLPIISSPYPNSTVSCQAQLYLAHTAWTMLFGTAVLKCARLRTIFLVGGRKLKKVTITNTMLLGSVHTT